MRREMPPALSSPDILPRPLGFRQGLATRPALTWLCCLSCCTSTPYRSIKVALSETRSIRVSYAVALFMLWPRRVARRRTRLRTGFPPALLLRALDLSTEAELGELQADERAVHCPECRQGNDDIPGSDGDPGSLGVYQLWWLEGLCVVRRPSGQPLEGVGNDDWQCAGRCGVPDEKDEARDAAGVCPVKDKQSVSTRLSSLRGQSQPGFPSVWYGE